MPPDHDSPTAARAGSIPRPDDEELTLSIDDQDPVVGAGRRRLDVPATLAGALAALGTLVLLSSIVGALVGTIDYQSGVDGENLSWAGLVAALIVLLLACLVGGWVAARVARHRGGLHGLLAPVWLIVLAAVLAGLAAVFGDDLDVGSQVGILNWFSRNTLTVAAVVGGVLAVLLMLLGGWLGGRLTEKRRHDSGVSVVQRRRAVRTRPGGIARRTDGSGR